LNDIVKIKFFRCAINSRHNNRIVGRIIKRDKERNKMLTQKEYDDIKLKDEYSFIVRGIEYKGEVIAKEKNGIRVKYCFIEDEIKKCETIFFLKKLIY